METIIFLTSEHENKKNYSNYNEINIKRDNAKVHPFKTVRKWCFLAWRKLASHRIATMAWGNANDIQRYDMRFYYIISNEKHLIFFDVVLIFVLSILFSTFQSKTNKPNAPNRNKNPSNDTSAHFPNNTNPTNNSTPLPWKTVQNNNNNNNTGSNHSNSTLPSYLRLGGGQRSKDDRSIDASVAGTSSDRDSVAPSMKYRTSISDLGGSSSALVQFTNTRIKSIKNRRGAVKYQKYFYFSKKKQNFQESLSLIRFTFAEHTILMGINLWRNFFDSQHFALFVKNSCGDLVNKDTNAIVSLLRYYRIDAMLEIY